MLTNLFSSVYFYFYFFFKENKIKVISLAV